MFMLNVFFRNMVMMFWMLMVVMKVKVSMMLLNCVSILVVVFIVEWVWFLGFMLSSV